MPLAHPPPLPVVPADRAVAAARAYAAHRRGRAAFAQAVFTDDDPSQRYGHETVRAIAEQLIR